MRYRPTYFVGLPTNKETNQEANWGSWGEGRGAVGVGGLVEGMESHRRGPWRPTAGSGPRPCSTEALEGYSRQTDTHTHDPTII